MNIFGDKTANYINSLFDEGYELTFRTSLENGKTKIDVTASDDNPLAAVVVLIEGLHNMLGGSCEDILTAAFNPTMEQINKLLEGDIDNFKDEKPYKVKEIPDGLVVEIDREKMKGKDVDSVVDEVWNILHG